MNSRSAKFIAVFAVMIMALTSMGVLLSSEEQNISAAEPDYKHYYYDQLTESGKWVYDALVAKSTEDSNSTVVVEKTFTPSAWTATDGKWKNVHPYISSEIEKGVRALSLEQPIAIAAMNLGYNTSMPTPPGGEESIVSEVQVSLTLKETSFATPTRKTVTDSINAQIDSIKSEVNTGSEADKVTKIHKKVVDTLKYGGDDPLNTNQCRSLYTALCGDHTVVCEGYAKMFKALCDACDIPCITLVGQVKTGDGESDYEGHMWNCVKLSTSSSWYIMDCTWDDQESEMKTTYLMTGTEEDGFKYKVGISHDPTRGDPAKHESSITGYGFTVVPLSKRSQASGVIEFIVTYMNGSKVFAQRSVVKDTLAVDIPGPSGEYSKTFYGWSTTDGSNTPFDFTKPVTADVTVYAYFTSEPVFHIYLKDGDSIFYTFDIIQSESRAFTNIVPEKADHKFLGWNTAADGSGTYYVVGQKYHLDADTTLYAVWESTVDNSPFNIDTLIKNLNDFLSKETIPGISNTFLVIGIASAIIIIVAFLAIAAKKVE